MKNKHVGQLITFLILLVISNTLFSQNTARDYLAYSSNQNYTRYEGGALAIDNNGRVYSDALPIGFTFNFAGQDYTEFKANIFGWITLGEIVNDYQGNLFSNASEGVFPLIALFTRIGVRGGIVTYRTIGNAPNRKLIVQYDNWELNRDSYTNQSIIINAQIILTETTNTIELAFGGTSVPGNATLEGQMGIAKSNQDFYLRTGDMHRSSRARSNQEKVLLNDFNAVQLRNRVYGWRPSECTNPYFFEVEALTNTTATLSFNASPDVQSYQYVLSTSPTNHPLNSTPVTGTVNENRIVLENLEPQTRYYLWVRSVCEGVQLYDYVGFTSFTTHCEPILAPTDNLDFQFLPSCWSNYFGIEDQFGISPNSSPVQGFWSTNYIQSMQQRTASVALGNYFVPSWLVSSPIDLGSQPNEFVLKYDYHFFTDNELLLENIGGKKIEVFISRDGGFTWDENDRLKIYTGQVGVTQNELIDLSSYSGVISIAFVYSPVDRVDLSGRFSMTNFQVIEPQECSPLFSFEVDNLTHQSVTISWEDFLNEPERSYEYYLSTVNSPPNQITEPTETVIGSLLNIDNLQSNTTYYFWLKPSCQNELDTLWSTGVSFRTFCQPIVAPSAIETFDDFVGAQTENGSCWVGKSSGVNSHDVSALYDRTFWRNEQISTTGSSSACLSLHLERSEWLFSPHYDLGTDPGVYAVNFNYNVSSTRNGPIDLGVGVIDLLISRDGGVTWSIDDRLHLFAGVYNNEHRKTIVLDGYQGVVQFAFRQMVPTQSTFFMFCVDNFQIIEKPTCVEPSNIRLLNNYAQQAEVIWNQPELSVSGYEVAYSNVSDIRIEDLTVSGITSDTTLMLTNLVPVNNQYVYVRSVCADNQRSEWSNVLIFRTECEPINEFPWLENFEVIPYVTPVWQDSLNRRSLNMPECWIKQDNLTTLSNAIEDENSTAYFTVSGIKALSMVENVGRSNDTWVLTRGVQLQQGQVYRVSFHARARSSNRSCFLNLIIGMQQKITAMNTQIGEAIEIKGQLRYNWYHYEFTVDSDGIYYLGLNSTQRGPIYFSVLIDDFKIEIAPDCIKPTMVRTENVDVNQATLSWNKPLHIPQMGYEYFLSTNGSRPDHSTLPTGVLVDTTLTLQGLEVGTVYYFYVRSKCDDQNVSEWTMKEPFYTGPCLPEENYETSNLYFIHGVNEFTLNSDINNVQIDGFTDANFSPNCANVLFVRPGESIDLQLEYNIGSTKTNIWLDVNGDRVFDDQQELLLSLYSPTRASRGSFVIPQHMLSGKYFLRVGMMMSTSTLSGTIEACNEGYEAVRYLDFYIQVVDECSPVAILSGTGGICNGQASGPVQIHFFGEAPYTFTYNVNEVPVTQTITNNVYQFLPQGPSVYEMISVESLCEGVAIGSVQYVNTNNYNVSRSFVLCPGTPIVVGDSRYTTAGNYLDTLYSIYGCDSIVQTIIHEPAWNVEVSQINGSFEANYIPGATYKWHYCLGGYAFNDTRFFQGNLGIEYRLEVSLGSCTVITDCLRASGLSIDEVQKQQIAVFPNPTNDFATIQAEAQLQSIQILDANGRVIQTYYPNNSSTQLDLSNLQNGVYLLNIKANENTVVKRLIKQ